MVYVFIKVLYTIAPDKQLPSSFVTKGAVFTSFSWVISTIVYLYYVSHFADYTLYYSGLSNLAMLMIWIYLLAYIFVIGMGINYNDEDYQMAKRELKENAKKRKYIKDKM